MELEKVLQGLILSKTSEGKSPHTIKVYEYGFYKLSAFLDNPDIQKVTKKDIQEFFRYLRQEINLAKNSLVNIWRGIRVLFTWSEKELNTDRPDKDMPYSKAPIKNVVPFTTNDIKKLLAACNNTKRATTTSKRNKFSMKRPTALRDKATILTLLDTGVRVSELARLTIGDVNLESGEVQIRPYGSRLKSKLYRVRPYETIYVKN